MFAILILGAPFIGLLAGIWQTRRGMLGVAIDDHPCCDRCGYDLVSIAVGSACPECGNQPEGPRRIGNRARQPRRLALGLGLLCVSALALGTAIFRASSPGWFRSVAPLWAVRAEARTDSLPAINELARRLRVGRLSNGDVAALVDDALARRHSDFVGLRVAWGDVLDAGLASGVIDQTRRRRCYSEAVGVNWSGTSDLFLTTDGGGSGTSILFVFAPAVGPRSRIAFDADIESASLDGSKLGIGPKEIGVFYAHVQNSAARDTYIPVDLPARVAGSSLIVRWRIHTKDATTGVQLTEDWVHTETIAIPATGDGFLYGGRHRETGSDESAGP